MKFKFEKKYLYWGLTAFLVIVASILFYYILFLLFCLHNNSFLPVFHMVLRHYSESQCRLLMALYSHI